MIRARKLAFPIALAILVGCGGSGGSIGNAAHLRFFDALGDSGNVRLTVGGRLYRAGGDASIESGDDPRYGDVPSGTVSLVVSRYGDLSGGTPSALASLTTQTLVSGRSYTAVALLSGTTRRLVLFADGSDLDGETAYFRVVNANGTTNPLYLRVVDNGDTLYQTGNASNSAGLAAGANTGLQGVGLGGDDDKRDVTLRVYRDADFTDEIESKTITLTKGKSVTTFVYDRDSGSGLAFKSSTDRDSGGSGTATTGTTGVTDTTGTDGTANAGTTATPTTGTSGTGTSSTTG